MESKHNISFPGIPDMSSDESTKRFDLPIISIVPIPPLPEDNVTVDFHNDVDDSADASGAVHGHGGDSGKDGTGA